MQEVKDALSILKTLLFTLILCPTFMNAQSVDDAINADSLWQVWNNKNKSNVVRLGALEKFIEQEYLYSNPDSAFIYAQTGYDFAKKNDLKKNMANALSIQGSSFAVKKEFKEALNYHQKTLDLRKKLGDQKDISNSLQSIAMIYRNQNDLDKALKYFSESIRIKEEIGDQKGIAGIYKMIAQHHSQKGNYTEAIEYYSKSMKIAKSINDKRLTAVAIHEIGIVYAYQGKYDEALENFKKSLEIKESINDKNGIANGASAIGIIYYYKGDYDKSVKYHKKCLKIKKEMGDELGIANSLNGIGSVYNDQGNYVMAVEYFSESMKIYEKLKDKEGEAVAHQNIAGIYSAQEDFQKALEYNFKSLDLREEIGDKRGVSMALDRIGTIYNNIEDDEKAMEFYLKSLELSKEIGNKSGVGVSLGNIGKFYSDKGNLEKALNYYKQALNIMEEIGDKSGIATSKNNIGNINYRLGKYNAALNYSKQAMILAKEINSAIDIKNASRSLWKVYKTLGQYRNSLEMHELFLKMSDSLTSKENQRAIIQQEYKYEYEKQSALDSVEHAKEQKLIQAMLEKKEANLAKKEAEAEKKDAQLDAKRNQQYALFGGLGLVLIFSGFMYNRFRITRRQKGIIENQKVEVENQRDFAQKEHQEAEHQRHLVEEKNTEIMDSIQYAKRLQDAILPPIKLVKEYFEESFILFRPKDIVSGDFYWMETKDNLIMFAAADCTGHGVPGAMVSVVCANALNKSVNELGKTDPADILNTTRDLVIETFSKSGSDVKDGMDISLCVLNEGTQTLHWAGANNPLWIVRKDQNEIETIKPDKQPIGMYGELQPFTSHSIKINGGDSVYMFSDGYADQFGGERGKKMKSGKFKELLLNQRFENMEVQKKALEHAFETWKGELEQIDDVCVIGVRLTEKENNPFSRREMEIIQLLEQGKSSKMIADDLNISKVTVDTHRRKVLKKVGAGNVTELLKICKELKIL